MRIAFTKMHGLGNDFVVLDARGQEMPEMTGALAAALADRRTGIGCDQLILIEPSRVADFRMRIFNADGGEVEACGNATRAVGLLHGRDARVETLAGVLQTSFTDAGVAVDMGTPRFGWEEIPLAYAMDTHHMPVAWEDLASPIAVNIGNPHVIFFVEDCEAVDLERLGPLIEHDPLFPNRVNVNAASAIGDGIIRLRVWERGAGLTRACGTGACATAVAAMRRGLMPRGDVMVLLDGGPLLIGWDADGHVTMRGPAAESFRGSFDPADYGCAP
jgi:diaminopimelate epimerase